MITAASHQKLDWEVVYYLSSCTSAPTILPDLCMIHQSIPYLG